jgi:hypothetical protein
MENINQATLEAAAKDLVLKSEAGKRASADPLPGPLAQAFGPENITVGKYQVRPLVAYDWAILKLINSPVYRQMLEFMQNSEKPEIVEPKDQELWQLIYILTRPCREVKKVFDQGVNKLRDAADEEFGMEMNPMEIAQLSSACFVQVQGFMATMVKYAPQEEEERNGEGKPGFSDAGPAPATVLAGGSTT